MKDTIKVLFLWTCFVLLITIHTLDMELTAHYIGCNWHGESFPFMRWSIKFFGINNALWISRFSVYSLLYVYLIKRDSVYWQYLLILGTIVYWLAMIQWLFAFDILSWSRIEAWLPQLM